ncbi:MAG: hypothetical protein CMI30_08220 [Opitutae bacterium]|nr:hypothetical protein [Opitutae bacterium]|tara:strand:+ start:1908 stop:2921 length:1014 start_codon:yes stop_codon:yes gene_type:complete
MAKKKKKNDLEVSLFPFLSILACVLGILTLMITAVVLSQVNEESVQQQVEEALSDDENYKEKLEEANQELAQLRQLVEAARKDVQALQNKPLPKIDLKQKQKLQNEIKQAEEKASKVPKLRQQITQQKKKKEEDAKELAEIEETMGNVEGQLEVRKNPDKFATMVVKPSGSGLGGSVEPTFVECDAQGINVFGPDGKKAFSVKRTEISKNKRWLDLVQRLSKDAPFRTWWSKVGTKIDAKFIKREGGTVFLHKKAGGDLKVPAAQLQPRSVAVVRQIESARAAKRPDPVARYVIFLVRTKGISAWSAARQTCRDRYCKNGKIPLDGEGEIDLSMFKP